MRISEIRLNNFRRFHDLRITELPASARLIVLAGPNGSGKSSLFDAMNTWYRRHSGFGVTSDSTYFLRLPSTPFNFERQVQIEFHSGATKRGSFYIRSAYRNDPEFRLRSLERQGAIVDENRLQRMIEGDAAVTANYKRLVSQALEDIFEADSSSETVSDFRDRVIGQIREAVKRLFPDLVLNSLGNPLEDGTFRFTKGNIEKFEYKNLSGGEKAAFDLVLDIIVKRAGFSDAVYAIDEPEAHLNTKVQGALLRELYDLVPENSQLWLATHSIGMMRAAREIYDADKGKVVFLDFGDHDFDTSVTIKPTAPNRRFWESVLSVALDDLAALVAPNKVFVCEGNPLGAVPGKNAEHDATIYNLVFGEQFPDVKFIAGGNNKDVASDRLGFAVGLTHLVSGMAVHRLIDRDDHSSADVANLRSQGIAVLGRRHLESYLYDDEVLSALCVAVGKPEEQQNVLADKAQALANNVSQGKPIDDVKSAAGVIYTKAKQRLQLIAVGNDQMAFSRNTLAPLVKPGTSVYEELKKDIFGPSQV